MVVAYTPFSWCVYIILLTSSEMIFFFFFKSCRRVLIFPKGNNVDHLAMYLDVADAASLPYGWCRFSHFGLTVVNQINNRYSVRKGIFFLYTL